MHNKRALDRRLCRAVARLLVTMAWPPLGPSTRNTWQTRKQCARAALRRDFAHLGCAHANKLSLPLSLFVLFISPSFILSADFLSSFLFASFTHPHMLPATATFVHTVAKYFSCSRLRSNLVSITDLTMTAINVTRWYRQVYLLERIYSRTSFIRTGWRTRQMRR